MIHRLAFAFSCFAAFGFTSCQVYNKEYKALASVAKTTPKKDAIVGMWHRKANEMTADFRQSVLFRSDGTGMESYYLRDSVWGVDEGTVTFDWSYDGKGVWKAKSPEAKNYNWAWQTSQGKLIRTSPTPWRFSHVFERVSP